MNTKGNNKKRDLLLLGGAVLLAGAGGLYYISTQNAQPVGEEVQIVDESAVIETEEEALRQKEILKGFETSLNNFLQNIDQQVAAYQQRREIVLEMIKPQNLRQYEYVTENYGISKEIMEAMKGDMDAILGFITKSDMSIQTYLERENPDDRNSLSRKWNNVQSEQSELYSNFFALEKSLLLQIDRVFSVFLKSRGNYVFDVEQNNVVFQDTKIANEYMGVKRQIESILNSERKLLNEAQAKMGVNETPEGTTSYVPETEGDNILSEDAIQNSTGSQPVLMQQDDDGSAVEQPLDPSVEGEISGEIDSDNDNDNVTQPFSSEDEIPEAIEQESEGDENPATETE
jgi:hypothetical protein